MEKYVFLGMALQAAISGTLVYLKIIKVTAAQQFMAAGLYLTFFIATLILMA